MIRIAVLKKAFIASLAGMMLTPVSAVVITFQVRFSTAVPNSERAEVRTEFSGSGDHVLQKTPGDPLLYRGTFELPDATNGFIRYRFGHTFSTSQQMGFAAEPDPGRVVFLTHSTIVLPVAQYGVLNLTNQVTFQVDLRAHIELGQFDPVFGRIDVLGNFSEWRAVYMERTTTPGLYRATVPIITVPPGDELRFYFVANWEFPEDARERIVILRGGRQVIPPFYFGDMLPLNDTGRIAIQRSGTGRVTLSYLTAGGLRVQSTADPASKEWRDEPESIGRSSLPMSATAEAQFFRLAR